MDQQHFDRAVRDAMHQESRAGPGHCWCYDTSMFSSVSVVGRGRVGSAVAARFEERGLAVRQADVELVLLCVPDSAIATVAAGIPRGPWVAHVSGATRLSALAPHTRRFSVHPLQTFTRARGSEQ